MRARRSGSGGDCRSLKYARIQRVATSSSHLSRIVVGSGTVRRGQLIGYTGTTGLSTGCHLHFEVLVGGTPVDPMSWL